MNPDHGTLARYQAGCQCLPCRRAKKLYRVEWDRAKAAGIDLLVPAAPTHRKVQALCRLGWSSSDVAKRLGISQQAMARIMKRETIRRATAEKIDAVYRSLEMKIPPETPWTIRNKKHAERMGWPPPLAWEDIEAGILATTELGPRRINNRFDLNEIDHVWQSRDWTVPLSPLEKAEILRRWRTTGQSDNALERLTGWVVWRYSKRIPDLPKEAS